jgi:hypothetical protein
VVLLAKSDPNPSDKFEYFLGGLNTIHAPLGEVKNDALAKTRFFAAGVAIIC